ncbi:hypothetical protein M8J77_019297 [Diaphorina citri]|nr:hypothetical protein M8J77_019297 [Diaphorina citri]
MMTITILCLLIVVPSLFQLILCIDFDPAPLAAHYINVNIKGNGYFVLNKVGDSPFPDHNPGNSRRSPPSPNDSIFIEVEQHSNYLENLFAMDKQERDKRILEDLKQIIKESGQGHKTKESVRNLVLESSAVGLYESVYLTKASASQQAKDESLSGSAQNSEARYSLFPF